MMKRETFPVANIYVPLERRKTLDRKRVDDLAASMLEHGQQTPIWCGRTARASCWSRACTGWRPPRRWASRPSSASASTRAGTDGRRRRDLCRTRPSDDQLLRALSNRGAGLGHVAIGLSVAGECRPAALLDEGVLLPGSVAFSATIVALASAACWNLSTQIGASAATNALVGSGSAIFCALLCSCQPPQPKPTTRVMTKPATAPCRQAGQLTRLAGWTVIA